MSILENKIKHFQNLGFNVLDFRTYKSMLNQIGYDISIIYADKWGTINTWEGEQVTCTKCFYIGTDIAYCNIAGDHLKNERDLKSLQKLRMEYCFYFGDKIYMV